MPSSYRYISVLRPPVGESSAETLSFEFSQFNVNISEFSVDVPVTSDMTEMDIAQAIRTAFETKFAADDGLYQYNKFPGFSRNGYPPFTFVTVLCEHVIHIWSQVGFKITSSAAGTSDPVPTQSTALRISDIPIFCTIATAKSIGMSYGQEFTQSNGDDLEDAQIAEMLSLGSQQVIRLLGGFKAVASTYEQQVRGNYKLGYKFDQIPVMYEDHPVVRSPFFQILTPELQGTVLLASYEIDYEDGFCSFLNWGMFQRAVLDINNFLNQTYVAGYANVPEVCKQETVHITSFLKYNPAIKSLKQGTFQIVYRDFLEVKMEIQSNLNMGLGR